MDGGAGGCGGGAYVTHGWGGAAQTLAYARRKKKRIVLFSAK
jgi:hypothetical protein